MPQVFPRPVHGQGKHREQQRDEQPHPAKDCPDVRAERAAAQRHEEDQIQEYEDLEHREDHHGDGVEEQVRAELAVPEVADHALVHTHGLQQPAGPADALAPERPDR